MKIKLSRILVVLPLVAGLSGCVIAVGDGDYDRWGSSNWEKRQNDNREYIDTLTTGMNYAQVRHSMGNPDFKEAFSQNNDKMVVLFYRTDRIKPDGLTSKEECTPLVFTNDVLTGWGNKAYERI